MEELPPPRPLYGRQRTYALPPANGATWKKNAQAAELQCWGKKLCRLWGCCFCQRQGPCEWLYMLWMAGGRQSTQALEQYYWKLSDKREHLDSAAGFRCMCHIIHWHKQCRNRRRGGFMQSPISALLTPGALPCMCSFCISVPIQLLTFHRLFFVEEGAEHSLCFWRTSCSFRIPALFVFGLYLRPSARVPGQECFCSCSQCHKSTVLLHRSTPCGNTRFAVPEESDCFLLG